MQFATIISAISLALGASAAAVAVTPRDVNAVYELFGGFNCGAPDLGTFEVTGGSNDCVPFSTDAAQAINLESKNLKFQFTVFEEADCSDPGTILGTGGCFSDAAGLLAFKLVPF
ncbi:hypothetical protein GQ53DRAFT_742157 [Thozetella sp. PMI_491]|nr:hypothetical protein GQ53DRAFT_742157 [Thozetella sp. PMI_491]